MSKIGETTDRILELLSEGESFAIKELKEKIPSADAQILHFMSRVGLIELRNGKVNITEFGSDVLTVEQYL